MKLEKVAELIKECTKHDLSPNELILLYCLHKSKSVPKYINETHYKIALLAKGFINNKFQLEPKALNIFDDYQIDREKVEQYRQMWPSIVLPSGKNARASSKELEERFKWFFENFNYSWDIVFKATEEYIKYYSERGYNFMRSSAFFIFKESIPKLRNSDLEEWCDKVTNSNVTHESFDLDI